MRKHYLGLLLAGLALPSTGALAEGPYRTVTGPEPGKCIFSSQLMPPDRYSDPAYSQVTDTFGASEPVHARCFYEKPLGQYEGMGTTGNSLRDLRRYYATIEWERPPNLSGSFSTARVKTINRDYEDDEGLRRERFELLDSQRCTFEFRGNDIAEHGAYSSGCLNLAGYVQAAALRAGQSAPEFAEYCMRVYLDTADNYVTRRYNDGIRTHPEYKQHTIAEGCFKVRLSGGTTATANSVSSDPLGGNMGQPDLPGSPPSSTTTPSPEIPQPRRPRLRLPRPKIPGIRQ